MPFLNMTKKGITNLVFFVVWLIVWVLFLVRPYFIKQQGQEYARLLISNPEQKRALVVGPKLYAFIQFCNAALPDGSDYQIEGIKHDHLDYRRAVYYLYPHIKNSQTPPSFLIVYQLPGFAKEGYALYRAFDERCFILRKKEL